MLFIVLTVCAVYLMYKYLIWNFKYWQIRGVPTAKSWPVFGTYIKSSLQQLNFVYEIDDIYKKFRQSSSFVGVFSGRSPQLMILDSSLIKEVLITKFKNFHDNEFGPMTDKKTDPIFARNPFMLCGQEWKEKRSEISPAFTNQRIKVMHPVIEDTCRKMSIYIKAEIQKQLPGEFDAKQIAERYTADVVANCIYGIDSKAFTKNESVIQKMGANLLVPGATFIIYYIVTSILPFIKWIYRMPLITKKSSDFFVKLTKDAVNIREESMKNSEFERDDLLNYLLELKKRKNISEIDLTAHTLTFFLDGFETSSVVISYAMYYLGRYKEIQNKLRKEIMSSIHKYGKVNLDEISELQYLDQVFHETLRMKPPIGYLSKICTEPTQLTGQKDKKLLVEKGMIVGIPVYSIHHDPEYYTDPFEFNPDRFGEDNGGLKSFRDKGVYLGFGDGPRICLGMRFALIQSKAAIVEIIRNFEITVNPKTKEPLIIDPQEMFSMPTGGLWLNFEALSSD